MSLNGVQVRINGRLAPLSFAGPNQINAVVPYATTEPYASVQIQANGTSSNTVTLYTRDAHAAILATTHTNYSVVSQSNGAKPGETVVVFLTGLGATSPPVSDGIAVPLSPFSVVPASTGIYASVGGYDADLIFAGLTPGAAGLYQLNLEIPRSAVSGAADLLIGNAEDRVISDPASGALLHYTAGFATYSSVFIAQ